MADELEWHRTGDDEIWMEIARDGDTGFFRAPKMVVQRIWKWATTAEFVPSAHLKVRDEEDGEVRVVYGPRIHMKKFIETAQKGGPGPLMRMVVGDGRTH